MARRRLLIGAFVAVAAGLGLLGALEPTEALAPASATVELVRERSAENEGPAVWALVLDGGGRLTVGDGTAGEMDAGARVCVERRRRLWTGSEEVVRIAPGPCG
ncbi:MAG: hypothetical protein AAFV86_12930 [Pseudomonadota bacterium]